MYDPVACPPSYLVVRVLVYCLCIPSTSLPFCLIGNTFRPLPLPRYPIMNTLFLFCGTPKCLELSTCHWTSYPSSQSPQRIVPKVRPPSWLRSPATFSRKRISGFLSAASLNTSKIRVPRISSNPRLLPATEKDWQGNPPHQHSASGKSPGLIALMSDPYHSSPFTSCIAL